MASQPAAPTPMMAQYIEIKNANPDCLLFYRMGDFYELFFEDAEIASRALGITLTKRGKHQNMDIPMCGVPFHAAEDYLQKLISLGHRVAVCEQMEGPTEAKIRGGAKAVVRRDVVRLVTAGTITEDQLLKANEANYLLAVAQLGSQENPTVAFAWVDISTGRFKTQQIDISRLATELSRINPKEILLPDHLWQQDEYRDICEEVAAMVTPLARTLFDSSASDERIKSYYSIQSLEAFGYFSRVEIAAAGAIIAYIDKTQLGVRPLLDPPQQEKANQTMHIDYATRNNLEIVRRQSGEKTGSLLSVLDETLTGGGSRLLAARLSGPSMEPSIIGRRFDAVAFFVEQSSYRENIRKILKQAPDMERALGRLSLNRSGPRDLAVIGQGLLEAHNLYQTLKEVMNDNLGEISDIIEDFPATIPAIATQLQIALKEELPLLKRDGGFIASSFNDDLDGFRQLRDDSRAVIAQLQAEYSETTGVKSLKIRHNNVLGYFVDVTALHGEKLMAPPQNEQFIHRQTLASAMRFTTTRLGELETQIMAAGDKALALEQEIYDQLVSATLDEGSMIKAVSHALAVLDCAIGFAHLATKNNYCRPIVDNSKAFVINGGRHPVVELALKNSAGDNFIENDADLSPLNNDGESHGKIMLVTGPNMAGKSTYLRQNALLALMAQTGSYIPAQSAHIGVVDRLFSRVGAADDLARGRSTFMVEMIETAAILNQATDRSLVILDEIGRGTATFDGLSIAWATIEHLHAKNQCRAFFATHYHELTALAINLERVFNMTVSVREWQGDVIFLHKIIEGTADRSYGIQVAKLAGLPSNVVERARLILTKLEKSNRGQDSVELLDDLPLFASQDKNTDSQTKILSPPKDMLREYLDSIDPDTLAPKDALEILYQLKKYSNIDNSPTDTI